MSFRQMFDYCQPQTRAAKLPRASAIHPIESFEQAIEVVRGNSLTSVCDANPITAIANVRDCNSAAFSVEFDCVVNQVGKHLYQSMRIRKYCYVGLDEVTNDDATSCCRG